METSYPAKITSQENGSLLVEFVDLPDTFTEGDTLEEALFNGAEVLSAMLGWHLDQGHAIPAPSAKVAGAHYIAPDAKTQAVLLLRGARGKKTYGRTGAGVRYLLGIGSEARRPAPLAQPKATRPCSACAWKAAGIVAAISSRHRGRAGMRAIDATLAITCLTFFYKNSA